MKPIILSIAFSFALISAGPAHAAPEEVMPIVEDAHTSVMRKVFVSVSEFLKKVNSSEEKQKELQRWQSENAYGVGIRG